MNDDVALPALPAPGASVEELRQCVADLITWATAREPRADGGPLAKFLTASQLVDAGALRYTTASGIAPPPGSTPAYWTDYTPPTPIANLRVTPGIDFFLVEWDAPTYTQGGGNAWTDVYAANYSGTGPLPTFAGAVPVFRAMGALNVVAIPALPGQRTHFWVGSVTRSDPPKRQVDATGPTGGLNGVSARTGVDVTSMLDALTRAAETPSSPYSRIAFRADLFYVGSDDGSFSAIPFYVTTTSFVQGGLTVPPGVYMRNAFIANGTITELMVQNAAITNAKIVSMSVAKLTAGSIAVGEYAQSTGFVSGSSGWQIRGDGVAEFSGVIVRGTIYAAAGQIGGITIGSNYLRSAGYVPGTTGFQLKNDDTADFGSGVTFGGTLKVGTAAVSGTTMTGSGAVINPSGSLAFGTAVKNITLNGTTATMNGEWVGTLQMAAGAATEVVNTSTLGTVITGQGGTGTLPYTSTSRYTSVGSLTYTASITCDVLLTAEADYRFNGDSSASGSTSITYCAARLWCDFATSGVASPPADEYLRTEYGEPRVAPTPTNSRLNASRTKRFGVVAGNTYVFTFYGQAETPSTLTTTVDLHLMLQVIKR